MIFEELERNGKNFSYLQKFVVWLDNVHIKNPFIFEQVVKNGLYREIACLLRDVNVLDIESYLIMILRRVFQFQLPS